MCTACFSATDDFYDLRDQADDLHRPLQREVQQVGRSHGCALADPSVVAASL